MKIARTYSRNKRQNGFFKEEACYNGRGYAADASNLALLHFHLMADDTRMVSQSGNQIEKEFATQHEIQ
jgi:hypothetical protein